MKLSEALIAYNPGTAEIAIGPLIQPDERDWTDPFSHTSGAAYIAVRELTGLMARHYVMSQFIGIVVRDRVDMDAAHRAFLAIDEYRQAIPLDMVPTEGGRA
jgi:hypothetical protein